MGNRSGTRGGEASGPGKGSRNVARSRPPARLGLHRPPPPFVATPRVRLRPLNVPRPAVAPPRVSCTVLSVDELLAGWVSSLRDLHEPDTLDDCADYSRYLDEVNRARHDADVLCQRLSEEFARLVDAAARRRRRQFAV